MPSFITSRPPSIPGRTPNKLADPHPDTHLPPAPGFHGPTASWTAARTLKKGRCLLGRPYTDMAAQLEPLRSIDAELPVVRILKWLLTLLATSFEE